MTDEDQERLNASAIRFAKRHGLTLDPNENPVSELEMAIGIRESNGRNDGLGRLWLACFRRAVGEPGADTMGYGYIGKYVK